MEGSSTLPSANHAAVIAQQPKVDPEGTQKGDLPFTVNIAMTSWNRNTGLGSD